MTVHADITADTGTLAAFVCTDRGAEIARATFELKGAHGDDLHGGGLGGAARITSDTAIADTLLTEMGNLPLSVACECVTEIRKSGAQVIVIGEKSDIGTYRALRNAGAADYFPLPVRAEDIAETLSRAQPVEMPAVVPAAPQVTSATTVAVVGSNGGVGASLLAQNLAFHASTPKGADLRTALIDADLRFGSQAIDLDCTDTPGLTEALSAPGRVDQTFLNATMERLEDRLSLYAHPGRVSERLPALEDAFPRLLHPLKAEFDALILDMPRSLAFEPSDLHAKIEALILVIPGGYAGVNAAARLLGHLRTEAPDLRILPVLSELRSDAGLNRKDLARAIGQDIAAVLPRSDKLIRRAHRAAKPVVRLQPRSPYARAVKGLWQTVVDAPATQSKSRKTFFGKSKA